MSPPRDAPTPLEHGLSAPRRVGLVGPLPPPAGGMANQTRQLAWLLREAGVEVELVRTNAPYRPAWIGRLRGVRALFRLLPYVRALWRCAGRVELLHVMANSGWAWHLHAAPAVWIARLRGTPVIVNYRGGGAGAFLRAQAAWVRPTLRLANCVAVPSGFLHNVFARYGIRTEIVPNIVDLARFHPAARMPGAARGGPHFIVTRNLEPLYDIGTALEAFAILRRELPQARLTVAGSGPELASLQRRCKELGIEDAVRFSGRLDPDAMAALYREADVMLNPSRVDNMPNALLEAFASGVPVVSTDVGGIPYFAEDGKTALLVPPGDPRAMADAALRLVRDPLLAAALRANALWAASAYAWPSVQARLFEIYANAALGRAQKRASHAPAP
ncbi:MAG: glycosyltransferase family 4 protein [Burkholderiales bacterium]|nr:glycosyltransferase family 4 protein [Burkholderiales bacterium]PZN02586.1 MAG: glycosyl transferase family 1 [Pseudomonadota bacterium]